MQTRADWENIKKWIEGLNQFNSTPEEGTTRVLFTKEELQAREYIKKEMKSCGLQVEEDGMGNIFATLKGEDSSLPAVWTGSHIDTVLNAGMFDGMAGVVCGMEALRMIQMSSMKHKRDIKVVVYTSEEPTRFGLSCLGSRALSGNLNLEDTKNIYDKEGKSLYEVLVSCGFPVEDFDKVKKNPKQVYASIELHIEQNDTLDRAKIPIGIVKGICAPTNYEVVVTGVQSHAGGTSMQRRRDAYMAACEIALKLEQLTKESKGEYITGTVGRVHVFPNAVNVIPGRVQFSIDIRSIDFETKDCLVKELKEEIKKIEEQRQVKVSLEEQNHDIPYRCEETLVSSLEKICKEKNIPYQTCISGAYHDSLFIGRIAPTAMIFVPSRDGISHSKEEWTDYKDLALGTEILAEELLILSNK